MKREQEVLASFCVQYLCAAPLVPELAAYCRLRAEQVGRLAYSAFNVDSLARDGLKAERDRWTAQAEVFEGAPLRRGKP